MRLGLDEAWIFLDARNNPVHGRKLTYRLADGTIIEVDVTMEQYKNPEYVKGVLEEQIAAHEALKAI